ncbi:MULTISPECIES: hypothetical protein [Lactococcus]|uniref:hypothetical protein n=1 Tax=Lactococcus TaxID=1357 RepID=UPI000EC918CD|nr:MULTISPECIES: hypothetical protein [Lactococcus]HAP15815.1 hypothetical protein [Lactococcus sp.]
MNDFEQIENHFSALKTENQTAIQVATDNILKAEQAQTKADKALLAAEEVVDVAAYNKAKDEIWSAKHAKELYQKQKSKLENEMLVGKDEYTSMLNVIKETADNMQEELNVKAAALVAELQSLAGQSRSVTSKANELMHTVQYDLYKDQAGFITKNGRRFTQPKEYKPNETVHQFYKAKIKLSYLGKRNGETENDSNNKYWG